MSIAKHVTDNKNSRLISWSSHTRWKCEDVTGVFATVTLAAGEVNTYLYREHLDEEEGRELLAALQEAFIEKEQSHD